MVVFGDNRSVPFRFQIALFLAAFTSVATPEDASALEGGIETYLLGSRDSMAGVLPPPGNYWNNDFVFFSGRAPSFSAGGVVVTDPEIDVFTYKLNFTHVFDAHWGNARLGLNINVPYVSADGTYSGELSSSFSGALTDSGESSFGDITVTPLFNWKRDKLHTPWRYSFFFQQVTINLHKSMSQIAPLML